MHLWDFSKEVIISAILQVNLNQMEEVEEVYKVEVEEVYKVEVSER